MFYKKKKKKKKGGPGSTRELGVEKRKRKHGLFTYLPIRPMHYSKAFLGRYYNKDSCSDDATARAGGRMLFGGDSVEVEVPCNWFKVDAISPPLKRRLDRDTFRGEEEVRRNERQGGGEKTLSLLSRSRVVMIEQGLLSATPIDRKPPL